MDEGDATLEWAMSGNGKDKSPAPSRQDRRERRLEEQLRENLKRRKEQARVRLQANSAVAADDITIRVADVESNDGD